MEFEEVVEDSAEPGEVVAFARAVIEGERDRIATLANISALLAQYLPRVNWVGFYLFAPGADEGILGPFQGRVACTRIRVGEGVVGTCAERRRSIVVPDVEKFPGHIACDKASRSEIVVPVFDGTRVAAVLDADAPEFNRFGAGDQRLLEEVARHLSHNWPQMIGA